MRRIHSGFGSAKPLAPAGQLAAVQIAGAICDSVFGWAKIATPLGQRFALSAPLARLSNLFRFSSLNFQ